MAAGICGSNLYRTLINRYQLLQLQAHINFKIGTDHKHTCNGIQQISVYSELQNAIGVW
jgi:hypothetical protein